MSELLYKSAMLKAAMPNYFGDEDEEDNSYGMTTGASTGPTLGSLQERIMHDISIDVMQRQMALMQLKQQTGNLPARTPLSVLMHKLGGGLLGYLISKYFKMGPMGQVLATVAGYGIGKVVGAHTPPVNRWSNVP